MQLGLTTRGAALIDLVVANTNTGKSVTIQTKTMGDAFVRSREWGPYWKWRVGTTRRPAHGTFFYAFVHLKGNASQTPEVFIVPSGELLPPLLEEYKDKSGKVIDVWCVIYDKVASKYRDNWDAIKKSL